jgi:hypothetical protein
VDAKFSISWCGWYCNEPVGTYEVGLWKNISRGFGRAVGVLQVKVNLGWHCRKDGVSVGQLEKVIFV